MANTTEIIKPDFHQYHLNTLKTVRESYCPGLEEAASRTGHDWFNSLNLPPDKKLKDIENQNSNPKRKELFELVSDTSIDTVTLCAVILAWGGMRVSHGHKLFNHQAEWRQAVEEVRLSQISRRNAYDLLYKLRLQEKLPGMGPAYFTKLIFFLRGPNVKDMGYIMDQWTGCSVNVLTDNPHIVLMNATYTWNFQRKLEGAYTVSDINSPDDYERFCITVDDIATTMNLPRMDAELLLMSQGRGKGVWRNYVIAHRRVQ